MQEHRSFLVTLSSLLIVAWAASAWVMWQEQESRRGTLETDRREAIEKLEELDTISRLDSDNILGGANSEIRRDVSRDITSGPGQNNDLVGKNGWANSILGSLVGPMLQEDQSKLDELHSSIQKTVGEEVQRQIDAILTKFRKDEGVAWRASDTRVGELAYNRPGYLMLNDPTPFQLVLSLNHEQQPAASQLEKTVPGERESRQVAIPTTELTAELRGSEANFDILPKGPQPRTATAHRPTIWTWHVTPLRPGETIPITVEILGYPKGLDVPGETIEVFTETFPINVDIFTHVVLLAKEASPLGVFGSLVAALTGAGWTLFLFLHKRSGSEASSSPQQELASPNGTEGDRNSPSEEKRPLTEKVRRTPRRTEFSGRIEAGEGADGG